MAKKTKVTKKEVIMNQTHGKDDLTPDVKRAAESIAQLCIKWGQQHLADQIRIDYGMKDVKRMDLKDSVFYNFAKKNKIDIAQHGWIREGDEMFPIVNIHNDIRKLDEFIIKVLENDKKISDR